MKIGNFTIFEKTLDGIVGRANKIVRELEELLDRNAEEIQGARERVREAEETVANLKATEQRAGTLLSRWKELV